MRHRTQAPFFLALLVMLAVLPGSALAQLQLVMQPVGSSQGIIQGESTVPDYEDWINLSSFQHSVYVPVDQNGVPIGSPTVSDLYVSLEFDRSTVRMIQALDQKEKFTSFTMDLAMSSKTQMPMALYRYELINGYITSISQSTGGGFLPSLSYSFSYSSIIITDLVQGTSVTYDRNPAFNSAPEPQSKGILMTTSPNPTHGQTQFSFSLPADSNAKLRLYDLRGHMVKEVFSGRTSNESTVVSWDGKDQGGMRVSQGVYLAKLTYPGYEVTQRITILR